MENTPRKLDKITKKKKGVPDDDNNCIVVAEAEEARRLRKRLRRAKKLAKHLEELELDESPDDINGFSLSKYPVRESTFNIPGTQSQVSMNPVVMFISVVSLWAIVFWCSFDSAQALQTLGEWRSHLSLTYTWLLQGTKGVFLVFVVYIGYKHGDIKLGKRNEKPEFSNLVYSAMIFTAGTGSALLTYCVSETLSHQHYHFYAQTGYRSQDEIDMFAINMAAHAWGVGGWVSYTVVAIAMSLAYYRFRLPMTFRSCFYPILGRYTWGWIGDFIDGITIVVTLSTVFTSLGLLAMNFVAGLVYMEWIDNDSSHKYISAIQNVVICIVTSISVVSIVSGLRGASVMCILAMGLATLLAFFVFVMEDSKFLLNVHVQAVGYYLQNSILQLNFWTDAFGQQTEGSGRAVDGKAAEQWWMEAWLNYTQATWVAASAVNGQFIAYISRGRNIREVILYTVIVPVFYFLIWVSVWGGIGLRQSRQAMELGMLGETYFNNSAHFMVDGDEFCYQVPQEDIIVDGNVVFTNHLPGVTPVCGFDEENADAAIFHVLHSFRYFESFSGKGLGTFLTILFMFSCFVFYMTVAGSAALVVDKMASSGRKNNHLARRMFWIVMVGALAISLLSTGGGDALSVIQAAMIIFGIPFVILLWYMLQCIGLFCAAAQKTHTASDYQFPNQPEFIMPVYGGILNGIEFAVSLGTVNESRTEHGMDRPTRIQLVEFLKGLVVPFMSMHQVLTSTYPQSPKINLSASISYGVCYVTWFCLSIAANSHPGLNGIKWVLFGINGFALALVRSYFRSMFDLRSNGVGDLVTGMFLWPQVWTQLQLQCSYQRDQGNEGNSVDETQDEHVVSEDAA